MLITQEICQKMLYDIGYQAIVVTENDSGMFVKYCGNGKINYKNISGILKTVNTYSENVYIYNL